MVTQVEADLEPALKGQLLRKKKDEELEREKAKCVRHEQTISKLNESIQKRKHDLLLQKDQLNSHQAYTEFLKTVVTNNALGMDNGQEQSNGIDALRSRFINLKNENKKLKMRKREIDQEMERIRASEQEQLNKMTGILYNKSREMQDLQRQIEDFQHRNSNLEQEFENEINKKNSNNKQVGQIFHSINNIYHIVRRYNEIAPGRRFKGHQNVSEDLRGSNKEFAEQFVGILNESTHAISDLIRVSKKVDASSQQFQKVKEDAIAAAKAEEMQQATKPSADFKKQTQGAADKNSKAAAVTYKQTTEQVEEQNSAI